MYMIHLWFLNHLLWLKIIKKENRKSNYQQIYFFNVSVSPINQ